jgi:hypothetical protein
MNADRDPAVKGALKRTLEEMGLFCALYFRHRSRISFSAE